MLRLPKVESVATFLRSSARAERVKVQLVKYGSHRYHTTDAGEAAVEHTITQQARGHPRTPGTAGMAAFLRQLRPLGFWTNSNGQRPLQHAPSRPHQKAISIAAVAPRPLKHRAPPRIAADPLISLGRHAAQVLMKTPASLPTD